ncbi:hypothetical protein PPERSA_11859 [Pseudocohnilembus persalinus]|uniref:Uncharacterized protein n=1 Tax=Pseudocohnilembus persalinus TaxID=266149 RepID=A0A0V0QJV0_PSEPJ|nr:hypothetical protein PPERSA_11859 [Pseudocohnilembus persalinus]|eukprot:KRX02519.1 hypothetical protein PPERSA_11859 [Pseudocohnilembus persalinus]
MFGSKKSDKYDIKMKLKKQNQLLSRVGDLANSVSGGASLFLGLDSPYHLTNQDKSLSNRNGISPRDIYQRSNTGSFNNNQQILSANQENLSNYQQIKSNFNTSRQINSIDDTPQNKLSDNYTQYMEQNHAHSNNINNPYNLPSSFLNQIQPQISDQLQDLYQDQVNILKNNQYNSDTLIDSSFSKKWWKNFQQKIYLLLNHTMSSKYNPQM